MDLRQAFLRVSLSAVALGAVSLAAPDRAAAACAIENASPILVNCRQSDFTQTLTYRRSTDELTLSGDRTVTTDFAGNDRLLVTGNPEGSDSVLRVQTITVENTEAFLDLGAGDDEFVIRDARYEGTILTGAGNDTVIFGRRVNLAPGRTTSLPPRASFPTNASVDTGSGNDNIQVSRNYFASMDVLAGSGNDTITWGGFGYGSVDAGAGNDSVTLFDGRIDGTLAGGTGRDTLNFTGGEVGGAITGFETVDIKEKNGARIGGTVTIEGTGTTDVSLTGTNFLSRGSSAPTFDLSGVDEFAVSRSKFRLSGQQGINELRLINNSRLAISGAVSLISGGSRGGLVAKNSIIDAVDGAADDSLRISAGRFQNSTLRFDVDAVSANQRADQLIFDRRRINRQLEDQISGRNILQVNFVAPTSGEVEVEIAKIYGDSEVRFIQAALSTFSAEGIGPNYDPTRELTLRPGNNGTVVLVSAAVDAGDSFDPPPAVANGAAAALTSGEVGEINTQLADGATGFGGGAGRTQISPTFGVFSNGSFGRVFHDGYSVSGGGTNLATPDFTADNFSLFATGELDASAQWGIEDIGLRLSVFGGYVQSYVSLDRSLDGGPPTPFTSTGFNEGAVLGGSVLVSKIQGEGNLNYALGSVAGLLGETDTTNGDNNGKGSYGTQGLILSAKVGRNMPIADRVRLDLRFGGSYVYFHGNSFTDSVGTNFSESETSYGLLNFEPGVSTAFVLDNGVRINPTARALMQLRVGYDNTAGINGTNFSFDDADFTVGGELGATANLTERLTAGAAIQGRLSEDQRSIFGKLSLSYRFGGGRDS
ncbi:autotransporter outer membrane beta-barrel domain-containing protein [Acuticoccus sp. MNP-M23]|uniref:autotransporter outer membrane beta-barrel domain-containing protein n=1 Tax=Acuticoccus sp. MNP-M23 TaxID=3072793 RepID=UPI002815EE49|nr:autotransporter outer membrane beta-barrel domain-containing protein [Acuticoccus sp. MNP-M23]WMS44149.1 autotransporter outer membrane beta-barrel domain-containing protein [Acuticoccus sp. MNP-M23]